MSDESKVSHSATDEPLEPLATGHDDQEVIRLMSRVSRVHTAGSLSRQSGTSGRISRIVSGQVGFNMDDTPSMGRNRNFPPVVGDMESYKVDFDGPDDPLHPLNWTIGRKVRVGGILSLCTLLISCGSAVLSPGLPEIMMEFHVGEVVATLTISLYVVGFALGPVMWGPLSELYGRKMPVIISHFLAGCFMFACATAKDLQTLMICRFFTGAMGAAPLSVAAAALSDMFTTRTRGVAMSVFSLTVMGGPMIAPVIGAYIAASHLHWRWTLYITGILIMACFVLLILFQDESYAPLILKWKAAQIRKKTGNWTVYAEIEQQELDLKNIVEQNLARPIIMLVMEPILLLFSIYSGFVYGILYLTLSAVPIIFRGYGWKGGNLMLPYLAIFLGTMAANIVNIFIFEPKFHRDLAASGKKVVPELRLPFMMVGAVFFTIGIFWLCWTGAYPQHVHWLAPVFGGSFYGFGFIALFIPVFNYVIDTYLIFAASALSGNAFLRGAMGAAFPLFASITFNNLGIQWAGTLLGCLAFVMMPVPFLFYKYGKWIRSKSKFAIDMDVLMAMEAKKKQAAQEAAQEGEVEQENAKV